MVKKLLRQRRRTGDIGPRHRYSGRKPIIVGSHKRQMKKVPGKRPDMTLMELRAELGLDCTLQAIHYALAEMDLTYRKRRSGPASKTART